MSTVSYDEFGAQIGESQEKQAESYQPSTEELKLLKKLRADFSKAKKKREKYDKKWADYYRFFRGEQWKFKRPSYRHSEVINLIFQGIQSQVPILTDSRPRFEFLAQDPTDREFAEILNEISSYDWIENNWLNILIEVVYEQHIFGTGLSSLTYDGNKNYGAGRANYESTDPFTFFPNSEAKDINRDCLYTITAEPKTLDWIKQKYPEKGRLVKPDVVDFEYMERSDLGDTRYKSPSNNFVYYDQERPSSKDVDWDQRAVLFTEYFLDRETPEDDEPDQVGAPVDGLPPAPKQKKLKYPCGRKVVYAGNVILDDIPCEYESFPYQKVQNYVLPREFWGISEVEQTEGPQTIYNKIYSFVLDVLTIMGNPIWVVDSTSMVNTEGLINKPGLVVEKAPGSEVRREEGTQLQPYVLNILGTVGNAIGDLMGVQEVSRGAQPGGITAADAIGKLQEAAQTRLRLKSRLLDCYLQSMGAQYLYIVLNYYTAPMVYRLTNDDGSFKYFKFYVEDRTDKETQESKKFGMFRPYEQGEDGKTYEGEQREFEIKGRFDVKVVTGTSLPFARLEKESKILNYFKTGLIDQEETLKAVDYPNYQAVLERMNQAKMQAQAQASQMAPAS